MTNRLIYGIITISSRRYPVVRAVAYADVREYTSTAAVLLHLFEGGSPYNDDSPPNLLRREVIHMISWVELIALLSLIVLIVDLVVSVYSGNKKN